MTITPTATKSGDAVSGTLAAKYNFMPWLEGEATFGTSGSVALKVEAADAVMKGLSLTAECDRQAPGKPGLLAAGSLTAEYKSELYSCKSSFDYYKQDLLASLSTALDAAFTMGVDCSYSAKKGAVQKYAAACQYVQPEFIVSAKCEDKAGAKTLSCGYYHKMSSDLQLGVALSKPLAKAGVGMEFGCAYKLDKATNVKGKVDADGILCASYKQKISGLTTMTLAAQVDTVNLAASKHKFGLQLNITP